MVINLIVEQNINLILSHKRWDIAFVQALGIHQRRRNDHELSTVLRLELEAEFWTWRSRQRGTTNGPGTSFFRLGSRGDVGFVVAHREINDLRLADCRLERFAGGSGAELSPSSSYGRLRCCAAEEREA